MAKLKVTVYQFFLCDSQYLICNVDMREGLEYNRKNFSYKYLFAKFQFFKEILLRTSIYAIMTLSLI